MTEHLTRAEALERLNGWADDVVVVTVSVFWIDAGIEARVLWTVGELEHVEDDHPSHRQGLFGLGNTNLDLCDLLDDGAPTHAFTRPAHVLSDGGVVLYAGASMRVEIRAPAPGVFTFDE